MSQPTATSPAVAVATLFVTPCTNCGHGKEFHESNFKSNKIPISYCRVVTNDKLCDCDGFKS